MRDLPDVEVEDVEAILLRGRAEPDVPAHPSRPCEGRVEAIDGHVRRADEVDLLPPRARSRDAQGDVPDPARHDVDAVEERVQLARQELAEEGRVVDSVHHDEELVERERAPHPEATGEHEGEDAVHAGGDGGGAGRLRRALGEEPLPPAAVLEDEVAGGVQRPERAVPEELVQVVRSMPAGRAAAEAGVERLPPHPDGVDLVDEDDALAAPLAGEPLRAAGEDADDDRVDPDERRREAGAGNRDERRVEPGRERLREHRLAGPGRAEEEQAPFPLAPGTLEGLARLPDRNDPTYLLLRLLLTAHVFQLHAPLRVPGLEGLDLGEVHQEQRAEQDDEVEDEEDGQHHEQREDLHEHRRVDQQGEREHDHGDPDRRLDREPPEPHPPARDHVLLSELRALEAEEARPRDQPVEDEVDEPAEADDEEERREDRPDPRPALGLVQPDDDGGGGHERDERRSAREAPPLTGELVRELALVEAAQSLRLGRHV